MPMRALSRLTGCLLTLTALFTAAPAAGNMVRLFDGREVSAVADCDWAHAADDAIPEDWEFWNTFINPVAALPDDGGTAFATVFQISEFLPNGINASGGTSGGWVGASGTYAALSRTYFRFSLDGCARYIFNAWVTRGSGFGIGHVRLRNPFLPVPFEEIEDGLEQRTGFLGPGIYELEGLSDISSSDPDTEGPTYSVTWICIPCDSSRIHHQPQDTVVVCDNPAVFSLTPSIYGASATYQWRRNGVFLPENGHYTGTSTVTLTIHNACSADEGYYDCIVTDGSVVEPSRLARLRTVATITGVDDTAGRPGVAFSVTVAGANPFAGGTSFRYVAATPQHATMTIYNVSGAKIRTLTNGVVSGAGTVTWDGTTESGSRAPAGIYFLRAEAGSIRESRKIVLLK